MESSLIITIISAVVVVGLYVLMCIMAKKQGVTLFGKEKSAKTSKPEKVEIISKSEWQKVLPLIKKNAIIFNDTNKSSFSKIGGKPNLPDDIEWPNVDGDPMSFVAQINLEDLPQKDVSLAKNLTGAVLVFAKLTDVDYCEPNSKNYKLIHIQNLSAPERAFPENLDNYDRFESTYLSSVLFNGDIPRQITDEIDTLQYQSDDTLSINAYCDVADEYYKKLPERLLLRDKAIKIGGYGNFMQGGGMEESPFAETKFANTKLKECMHTLGAKDYVLFMQIFSAKDKKQKMLFGDAGVLYIYVKISDLIEGKLENIVFVMQDG